MTGGRTVAKAAVLLGAAVAALFFVQNALPHRTLSDEARADAEKGIFKNGVPLELVRARGWPGLGEWEEAVAKFPSLDSCVVSSRGSQEPLRVDWGRISSDVEANVCLSRVATRIGSVDGVATWFNRQGFRVRIIPATKTSPEAREKTGTAVHASWSTDANGPLYKGGLLIWGLQRVGYVYGISCSLFIGDRRTVFSTNCVSGVL